MANAALGLCTLSGVWCRFRCPEKGDSSTDWTQLSRFHLKTETESKIRNVLSNRNVTVDTVQQHKICTNLFKLIIFLS
jgi:hypothetical protein